MQETINFLKSEDESEIFIIHNYFYLLNFREIVYTYQIIFIVFLLI